MTVDFAGKFQMMVLPQSGHAVHEDHPDKVEFCALLLVVAIIIRVVAWCCIRST